jgi:hypothetical protein
MIQKSRKKGFMENELFLCHKKQKFEQLWQDSRKARVHSGKNWNIQTLKVKMDTTQVNHLFNIYTTGISKNIWLIHQHIIKILLYLL